MSRRYRPFDPFERGGPTHAPHWVRMPTVSAAQHGRVGDPGHLRRDRDHPRRRRLLAVAITGAVHAFVANRYHGSCPRPGRLLLSVDASLPARRHQLGARSRLHGGAVDRRPLFVAWRQLRLLARPPPRWTPLVADCGPLGD